MAYATTVDDGPCSSPTGMATRDPSLLYYTAEWRLLEASCRREKNVAPTVAECFLLCRLENKTFRCSSGRRAVLQMAVGAAWRDCETEEGCSCDLCG